MTQNQLHWHKNCLDCKLLFKNNSNGVNLLKPSSDYREKSTIKPCDKTYFSCTAPTISTSLYEHTAVRLQAKERTCVCVCCQYNKCSIDNTVLFVALKHDTLPYFFKKSQGKYCNPREIMLSNEQRHELCK